MLATPIAPPLNTSAPASGDYAGLLYAKQGSDYGLSLQLKSGQTTGNTLSLLANAGQSGDLLDGYDNLSNKVVSIDPNGYLVVSPITNTLTAQTVVPGQGIAPAALHVFGTPYTISSSTTGGTDEALTSTWEAQKFNSGAYTVFKVFSLSLKQTGAVFPDTISVLLYTDVAGKPGTLIATCNGVNAVQLTAAFSTLYFVAASTAITPATDYWLVVHKTWTSATLTVDSRIDAGTNEVATSPDGTTWTLSATPKRLVYAVYRANLQPASFGGLADVIHSNSLVGSSFIGVSVGGTAIQGTSTYSVGGIFNSTTGNALTASTTYGIGGTFTSTDSLGLSVVQSGTLHLANANKLASFVRSGGNSASFNYSGPMLFINDAPVTSTSSGALIQAQAGSADVFNLSRAGTIVLTDTDAGTGNPTVLFTVIHKSTGTPAVGFGQGWLMQGHDAANVVRDMFRIQTQWAVATSGAQTSSASFLLPNAGAAVAAVFSLNVTTAQLIGSLGLRNVSAASGGASALYAPWLSGDASPAVIAGSITSGNNQTGLDARSDSGNGLVARSNSGNAVFGLVADAGTNNVLNIALFSHRSTASTSITAGLGSQLQLAGQSTTTADRPQATWFSTWVDATDATRKSRMVLNAFDSGGTREGLRIEASGTAPMIGMYGHAAVGQQTITGSRGGNAALASLLTALAARGDIIDSTTA